MPGTAERTLGSGENLCWFLSGIHRTSPEPSTPVLLGQYIRTPLGPLSGAGRQRTGVFVRSRAENPIEQVIERFGRVGPRMRMLAAAADERGQSPQCLCQTCRVARLHEHDSAVSGGCLD